MCESKGEEEGEEERRPWTKVCEVRSCSACESCGMAACKELLLYLEMRTLTRRACTHPLKQVLLQVERSAGEKLPAALRKKRRIHNFRVWRHERSRSGMRAPCHDHAWAPGP